MTETKRHFGPEDKKVATPLDQISVPVVLTEMTEPLCKKCDHPKDLHEKDYCVGQLPACDCDGYEPKEEA